MAGIRDLKGRPIEEALTSRDDVSLGDEDGVSSAVGKPIVVADNPHADEIAAALEKSRAEREARRSGRVSPILRANGQQGANPPVTDWPHQSEKPEFVPSGQDYSERGVRPRAVASVPLPEDFEAGLVALETSLREALGHCEALRARAHADHEKLARVEALVAALKG